MGQSFRQRRRLRGSGWEGNRGSGVSSDSLIASTRVASPADRLHRASTSLFRSARVRPSVRPSCSSRRQAKNPTSTPTRRTVTFPAAERCRRSSAADVYQTLDPRLPSQPKTLPRPVHCRRQLNHTVITFSLVDADKAIDPRLPSQSVDGDETAPGGFASAASAGEAPRPGGRPLPVLGGRVAGFASVTAFGFGHQSGLVGALNTAAPRK